GAARLPQAAVPGRHVDKPLTIHDQPGSLVSAQPERMEARASNIQEAGESSSIVRREACGERVGAENLFGVRPVNGRDRTCLGRLEVSQLRQCREGHTEIEKL